MSLRTSISFALQRVRRAASIAFVAITLLCGSRVSAEDVFLTIGGGYSPSGNQASLEKNVLFYQRLLTEKGLQQRKHHIYFADGDSPAKDLQVKDVAALPKANQLMAEFFGSEKDLGLYYRDHEVPGVRAMTSPLNIRQWFRNEGKGLRSGDRLVIYVTAHGKASSNRREQHNTSITLWNNQKFTVRDLVAELDQLPEGVSVATIMVQCHAGGFARFIYNEGDPDKGFSKQPRCGFFATLHDRIAAGCTAEVDEATYVEYSTYFWEAISGRTRTGTPITLPDYDKDGSVSFDEAHAYTILQANTIDLPIKTSGEFLGVESLFSNSRNPDLMSKNANYSDVLALATPIEQAILNGLSKQLDLSSENRIERARRSGQNSRQGRRGDRGPSQATQQLRQRIAGDLKRTWPALGNVLNPKSIELLTTRSQEFVQAVEKHPRYREYRKQASNRAEPQKRSVKYERFVRTAENVILRENLRRLGDDDLLKRYHEIVARESATLNK